MWVWLLSWRIEMKHSISILSGCHMSSRVFSDILNACAGEGGSLKINDSFEWRPHVCTLVRIQTVLTFRSQPQQPFSWTQHWKVGCIWRWFKLTCLTNRIWTNSKAVRVSADSCKEWSGFKGVIPTMKWWELIHYFQRPSLPARVEPHVNIATCKKNI